MLNEQNKLFNAKQKIYKIFTNLGGTMKYILVLPILIAEFFIITLFIATPIGTAAVIWLLTIMFYAYAAELFAEMKNNGTI